MSVEHESIRCLVIAFPLLQKSSQLSLAVVLLPKLMSACRCEVSGFDQVSDRDSPRS